MELILLAFLYNFNSPTVLSLTIGCWTTEYLRRSLRQQQSICCDGRRDPLSAQMAFNVEKHINRLCCCNSYLAQIFIISCGFRRLNNGWDVTGRNTTFGIKLWMPTLQRMPVDSLATGCGRTTSSVGSYKKYQILHNSVFCLSQYAAATS